MVCSMEKAIVGTGELCVSTTGKRRQQMGDYEEICVLFISL
jgi:hypothetical protein